MVVEGEFVFSNFRFSTLSGYTPEEIGSLKFEELFNLKMMNLTADFKDPKKSISRETILICKDKTNKEVVISASQITFAAQTGYIIVIKEVSGQMQFEKDSELLSGELQTLLLMMHQPLKAIARDIRRIHSDASVREAVRVMSRRKSDILFVNHGDKIVGVRKNAQVKWYTGYTDNTVAPGVLIYLWQDYKTASAAEVFIAALLIIDELSP